MVRVVPRLRMASMSFRRSGTVSNMALKAKRNPTNAERAENSPSACCAGAEATLNS